MCCVLINAHLECTANLGINGAEKKKRLPSHTHVFAVVKQFQQTVAADLVTGVQSAVLLLLSIREPVARPLGGVVIALLIVVLGVSPDALGGRQPHPLPDRALLRQMGHVGALMVEQLVLVGLLGSAVPCMDGAETHRPTVVLDVKMDLVLVVLATLVARPLLAHHQLRRIQPPEVLQSLADPVSLPCTPDCYQMDV